MEIQGMESINNYLNGLYSRSPRAYLVNTFQKCRKLGRISLIGDAVLISHIVSQAKLNMRFYKRSEFVKAISSSGELSQLPKREKNQLCDFLESLVN